LPVLTSVYELKITLRFFYKTRFFFPLFPPSFNSLLLQQKIVPIAQVCGRKIRTFQKFFYPFPDKRLQILLPSNPTIFRTKCANPSNYRETYFLKLPSKLVNFRGSLNDYRISNSELRIGNYELCLCKTNPILLIVQ